VRGTAAVIQWLPWSQAAGHVSLKLVDRGTGARYGSGHSVAAVESGRRPFVIEVSGQGDGCEVRQRSFGDAIKTKWWYPAGNRWINCGGTTGRLADITCCTNKMLLIQLSDLSKSVVDIDTIT